VHVYVCIYGYVVQLFIVRACVSSPTEVVTRFVGNEFFLNTMHYREVAFRHCDSETRKRRSIVKMISVINMEGVAMNNIGTCLSGWVVLRLCCMTDVLMLCN
jgi:hypothetical protein